MPKRIDHPHSGPSPTLANIVYCECGRPTGSPGHVCAPKAVSA